MDGRAGDGERSWTQRRQGGPAAELLAVEVAEPAVRSVSVLEVDGPALVLGSTQPEDHVDGEALAEAGVALVRRRSGGGAVLLVPGQALWIDVVLPRDDPRWDDDVGRSALWLGAAWAAALGRLGMAATVHRGGWVRSRWSPLVCFGGIGPGEVSVGGRKVVGISQRRSRAGARFQCVVLRRWDPAPLVALLRLDAIDAGAATAALAAGAAGVERPLSAVADALLESLSSADVGPVGPSGGKGG